MFQMRREDWVDFEKLIFKMLQDIFNFEENEKNYITSEIKDGGYDGVFFLPVLDGRNLTAESLYKTIFEAKLRSAYKKDLPLSDFSKSLIIAVNISANMIIIATNVYFTEKTVEVLKEFSQRTNLQVKVITSKEIMEWIRRKRAESVQLPVQNENLFTLLELAEETAAKNYTPEITLKRGESVVSKGEGSPPILIGESRNSTLRLISDMLQKRMGIVILSGEAGVGKSVLSNAVLNRLEELNINTARVDIQQCVTPRILFIKILENFWHIPADILLRTEDLEAAIEWIGNGRLQEDIKRAVVYAFQQSDTAYQQKADLFNHYLIEYLKMVYSEAQKKVVFSFFNVNYASKELLSFLLRFYKCFQYDLAIIVEIRDGINASQVSPEADWESSLVELRGIQNILLEHKLQPLQREESKQYIKTDLYSEPIDEAVLDEIINVAGNNPLFLNTYVNYLMNVIDLSGTSSGELALLSARAGIDYSHQAIRMLLLSICGRDALNIELFTTVGILNGLLRLHWLEGLYHRDYIACADYLIRANMFGFKDGYLFVKHSLYLSEIQKYEYISEIHLQTIAELLVEQIDEIFPDQQQNTMTRIRLAVILRRCLEVAELSLSLMNELYDSGQYYLCYQYGIDAVALLDDEQSRAGVTLYRIRLLMLVIQSSFYIKGISLARLDARINRVRALINLNRYELQEDESYKSLNCRFYLIENQYHHHYGRFQEAYSAMEEAVSFLEANAADIEDVELAGELWLEFGIATKEIASIEAAIEVLKKGLALYPDSKLLQFTLNTHLYIYYVSMSVPEGQRYIEENIALEPYLKPSEVYHNRVHELCCWFQRHDYDRAQALAFNLLEKTAVCGLRNEEGRIYNILGCLYMISGRHQEAGRFFQKGLGIFESDNYISNLWPLLVNYSTYLIRRQQLDEAKAAMERCVSILSAKYRQRIRNMRYDDQGGIPNLLAGVMTLYLNVIALEERMPEESFRWKAVLADLYSGHIREKDISTRIHTHHCNHNGVLLLSY